MTAMSSQIVHTAPTGFLGAQYFAHIVTLSAALDLSTAANRRTLGSVLVLDPGGASRDVTLEPEAEAKDAIRLIINAADAAENLVIKSDAPATLLTLGRGEWALMWCDGTTWNTCVRGVHGAPTDITDPGNAGAISVANSGSCSLVTAGAETRTLARPTAIGQVITLYGQTLVGNCAITVAAAFNAAGNTVATLTTAGQSVTLRGIHDGSNLTWRLVNDGATLS